MTKEEYIKDLIAQGMTMEQIKPLADAFVEQEQTVEEPQEEIIEEVKTEVVTDQTGATVTTTPEQASEIDTELKLEDGSSELLTPENIEKPKSPSSIEKAIDIGSTGLSLVQNPATGLTNLFKLAKKYDENKEDGFEVDKELKDIPQRVLASTLNVGETLANIPGYLNRITFNIAKSFAGEEFQEKFDSMEAQEQDDFIQDFSSTMASTRPGTGGFVQSLGEPGREKAVELKKSAEKWREDLEVYDNTIGQAFAQGQLIEGATRTFAAAVETIPSIIQAMIPGGLGIGSIVVGQAAQADVENIAKGEKLNTKNLIYSTIIGASEGLLEITTRKIGSRMFKDLAGKSKEYVKETLKGVALKVAKESGSEGLSESATLTINNAADKFIMGDEKAFENYWLELADTFIIGSATGGGMSGTGSAATIIRNAQANNSIRRNIENSQYNSVLEAFDKTEATEDKIKLAENKFANRKLELELKQKVSLGDLTIEQANDVETNFRLTQGAVNQIKPLNLSDGAKPEVVNLLQEKNKLSQEIKSVNELALTQEQSNRVKEIDKQLSDIIVKDKTAKIDVGAKAVAEQLEVGIETFDTTEDTAGAIETLKNQGGKVDVKNSTDYGTIVEIPNDQGGIDTQIIINKQEAAADNVVTTSQHEVLHAVLSKTTKGNPDATIALGKSLLNELRSDGVNLGGEFEARLDQYVKDPNISEADVMEEVMTLASEGLTNGEITINESTLTKIGNAIKKFFGLNNLNIRFNTGKDVLNFIRDYNKSVQKGKGLSKSQLQVAKEGAKGKLIDNAKVEAETIVAKQSKSPQGEQASAKVQEIYDAKGKDGAFEIIEQFEPIVSRIVEKRSEAPNFDRQLLTDEINTGKRGIIDLIAEYNPAKNKSLAAFVNTFLPSRAIEASQRVLGEEFTTDVTEARGVIAEETKQPETVVSRKVKKPSETTVFDKATETRIDEAINKNFKGDDVKFSETKNIPKEVADIYAESLGINPETIVDKRRNYSKKDAEGLTKAKQLLLKNAKDDYARLPELKDDFGKGTFVPKNVKDALYTDGKLTGSLKDYIDLIRQKPVKPIYRDRVGQTIRGLLNLTIRNRILETAQPLQAKRLQSGAKFSKKRRDELIKKADQKVLNNSNSEDIALFVDTVVNIMPKYLPIANFFNSNNFASRTDKFGRGHFMTGKQRAILITDAIANEGDFIQQDINKVKVAVGTKTFFVTKNGKKQSIDYGSSKYQQKVKDNYDGLELILQGMADMVQDYPETISVVNAIFDGASGNSGHFIRQAAIPRGEDQGFVEAGFKGEKEHVWQQNEAGLDMLDAIKNNTVSTLMPYIRDNYFMIGLSNVNNNKLSDVSGQYGTPFNFGDKLPQDIADSIKEGIKKGDMSEVLSIWGRYFNESVNNVNGGIDPNTITFDGKNVAEIQKVNNVAKSSKKNPNIKHAQQGLISEQITKDIDSKTASSRLKAYEPIAELEFKASKNNTVKFGDKVNNEMTVADQLTMLGVYDKAASVGRKLDTPKKGISVFDFDDTLAETKEKVIVNNSDGTTVEISAAKFAEQAGDLEAEGATFDFSNFEKVGKGTQKGPLADLALKRQGKFGSKRYICLTARPQIAAEGIKKFLDGIGLSIPLANITGLENGSPGAKGNWVAGKAAEGYNDFYFADDAYKNVQAVQEVLSQIDVNSVVQIAKSSKKRTFDKVFNDILESSTGIEILQRIFSSKSSNSWR